MVNFAKEPGEANPKIYVVSGYCPAMSTFIGPVAAFQNEKDAIIFAEGRKLITVRLFGDVNAAIRDAALAKLSQKEQEVLGLEQPEADAPLSETPE